MVRAMLSSVPAAWERRSHCGWAEVLLARGKVGWACGAGLASDPDPLFPHLTAPFHPHPPPVHLVQSWARGALASQISHAEARSCLLTLGLASSLALELDLLLVIGGKQFILSGGRCSYKAETVVVLNIAYSN